MEMPGFLSSDYDKTLSICTMAFPEDWMGKAFIVVLFLVFIGLPIPYTPQWCTICGLDLKGPSQPPPFSMTSKLLIKHGEANSSCFTVSCVPEGTFNYLE